MAGREESAGKGTRPPLCLVVEKIGDNVHHRGVWRPCEKAPWGIPKGLLAGEMVLADRPHPYFLPRRAVIKPGSYREGMGSRGWNQSGRLAGPARPVGGEGVPSAIRKALVQDDLLRGGRRVDGKGSGRSLGLVHVRIGPRAGRRARR